MNIFILTPLVAILVLVFCEFMLPNQVSKKFTENTGKSWARSVVKKSFLSAMIVLIISICMIGKPFVFNELNFYIILTAISVMVYAATQSFMTDFKLREVNRNMLRVSYIIIFICSILFIHANGLSLSIVLVFCIILLFSIALLLFVPDRLMGASDARALLLAVPFTYLLTEMVVFYVVLGVFAVLATIQQVAHSKHCNPDKLQRFRKKGMPLVPYIITPCAILSMIQLFILYK